MFSYFKLNFIALSLISSFSVFSSQNDFIDKEIKNINQGGRRALMDAQSSDLVDNQKANEELKKVGQDSRRATHFKGRNYSQDTSKK